MRQQAPGTGHRLWQGLSTRLLRGGGWGNEAAPRACLGFILWEPPKARGRVLEAQGLWEHSSSQDRHKTYPQ